MNTKLIPSIKVVSVINHKRTGEKARELRVAKKMDYSAPFISDLELGRRKWTQELADLYSWALRELLKTLSS